MADAAINPDTKSEFFEFERRWMCLARGSSSKSPRSNRNLLQAGETARPSTISALTVVGGAIS
jgi:hypothetical protein